MRPSGTARRVWPYSDPKAVEELNQTFVTEFILLGITSLPQLKILFFITFLMFYLLCFLGNLSIVAVVLIDHGLHTPMYFLLGNLSFLDFFFSTTTVPKLLSGLIMGDKRISFQGCIAQLYVFHFLGSTEAMLLTSMSYDRYIAICNPLRYHVLMSTEACIQLAFTSWLIGFLYSLTQTIPTVRLTFCSFNKVTAFYCDIKPLLNLACTDTHINESLLSIITGIVALGTFISIVISYIFIATHLQNIQSSQGRHKALSTCTSHLTVVLLYYGTAVFTYLRPATKGSLEQDRISAIVVTVITPALNPLIYALRNKEVKRAFRKSFYDGYTFKHLKTRNLPNLTENIVPHPLYRKDFMQDGNLTLCIPSEVTDHYPKKSVQIKTLATLICPVHPLYMTHAGLIRAKISSALKPMFKIFLATSFLAGGKSSRSRFSCTTFLLLKVEGNGEVKPDGKLITFPL
ncbi:PREDICTED: olfactory receptor 12D2-like [Nanorana parkeri]|uniref:olfactory receptor 12D2-like n=1 Tax=Nanorana parkeri TaxID=125878 RepID=UPI0008541043|nr:PREDICTED: olfactory receptor 12D2-like [Nanorana parkeri]